jgi:hypothetical protein
VAAQNMPLRCRSARQLRLAANGTRDGLVRRLLLPVCLLCHLAGRAVCSGLGAVKDGLGNGGAATERCGSLFHHAHLLLSGTRSVGATAARRARGSLSERWLEEQCE